MHLPHLSHLWTVPSEKCCIDIGRETEDKEGGCWGETMQSVTQQSAALLLTHLQSTQLSSARNHPVTGCTHSCTSKREGRAALPPLARPTSLSRDSHLPSVGWGLLCNVHKTMKTRGPEGSLVNHYHCNVTLTWLKCFCLIKLTINPQQADKEKQHFTFLDSIILKKAVKVVYIYRQQTVQTG